MKKSDIKKMSDAEKCEFVRKHLDKNFLDLTGIREDGKRYVYAGMLFSSTHMRFEDSVVSDLDTYIKKEFDKIVETNTRKNDVCETKNKLNNFKWELI